MCKDNRRGGKLAKVANPIDPSSTDKRPSRVDKIKTFTQKLVRRERYALVTIVAVGDSVNLDKWRVRRRLVLARSAGPKTGDELVVHLTGSGAQ